MDGARGFRGWLAAITVALTLTLVFLAVEKHIRIPNASYFHAARTAQASGASTAPRGIVLTVDPGLAGVSEFAPADTTPISRKEIDVGDTQSSSLLRRPPEPAASVVLQAPVALDEVALLPLHGASSKIDYLMDAMDKAFESPMHSTSAENPYAEPTPTFSIQTQRLAALPEPASISGRIPEPNRLYAELADLEQRLTLDPLVENTADPQELFVSRTPRLRVESAEALELREWIKQTRTLLRQTIVHRGLEHPASAVDLLELAKLADQATQLGNKLPDHNLARFVNSVSYSLERRVAVWQAIQQCLSDSTAPLATGRNPDNARQELVAAISAASQKIGATGDSDDWQKYLMLDELEAWAQSPGDIWKEGNSLALVALSRLHWQRLSEAQQRFLAQPEFEELGSQLLVWGRDPIDYRQLLSELETLEEDPISRVSAPLAGAVQVLRLSREPRQQALAAALNNHYRNANLRLSIAQPLIERLLPQDQVDSRPVRQNILGADTAGDSSVRTQLRIKLTPDDTAWNVGIGVEGDLFSLTRSSKGPAVFHNMSTAQIDSQRYVRIDPQGYQVTSAPTQVASQDYLRNMSTDFDSLPIIGDLARFLVREQFNQKRGVAKRITQRIIAREADAELDRRLEESLLQAEKELTSRLVGPLERLNLNPLVVAMNTTEDRITIRYRVANEAQMAASTPRPRAPTDSLLSMQVHQTAINNSIAQIGLSGREWTLAELYERLGEAFQGSKWSLPADMLSEVEDITIRFADSRAATVELIDGKLRLTLRIAEFRQGDRFHIERFIVSSNYIPVADGMTAELIRDGVVEIISNHDRLKLRVIFAKIFVANPQIPLISDSWATDPRCEGLAVSQVEIRDGWLAVAISHADSERAAEVTARAHELRNLR